MPDAGMDSIMFNGSGTSWRLEVTALEGNDLHPPVITANGRDVEVSFKAQPLPSMEAGRYDLNSPGRVGATPMCPHYASGRLLHRLAIWRLARLRLRATRFGCRVLARLSG